MPVNRSIDVDARAGDRRTLTFAELAEFVDEARAAGVADGTELIVATRVSRQGPVLKRIRTGRVPGPDRGGTTT